MTRVGDPRRITHLFPSFLGLRLVPVGLFFVIVGIASPLVGIVPTAALVALLAIAVAAVYPIHRWYRREFGVVEPERLALGRNWAILAGLLIAVLAMGVGAQRLGGTSAQVLLLVVVFFLTAALFALPRAFGGGGKALAALVAIVVLGVALLLAAGSDPVRFNHLGALFSLVVGVTLCTAGVIEHRLLARTFDRNGAGFDV